MARLAAAAVSSFFVASASSAGVRRFGRSGSGPVSGVNVMLSSDGRLFLTKSGMSLGIAAGRHFRIVEMGFSPSLVSCAASGSANRPAARASVDAAQARTIRPCPFVSRQAIPRLRAAQAQRADAAARQGLAWGGACIINLSSAAGHLGMPGRAAYSASKWAVVGLSKTLALELGPEGIRVNAILPGAVEGPRIRAVMAARAQATGRPVDQVARDYTGQSALGRLVTAQDIAQMAVFVASDAAASITGQSLAVDGLTQALS